MGIFSWKKIKEGASPVGRAAAKFAGKLNSLYKTFKPIIDPIVNTITYGAGSSVLDTASKFIDQFSNYDNLSQEQNDDLFEQGKDIINEKIGGMFSSLAGATVVNPNDRGSTVENERRGRPDHDDTEIRQFRS